MGRGRKGGDVLKDAGEKLHTSVWMPVPLLEPIRSGFKGCQKELEGSQRASEESARSSEKSDGQGGGHTTGTTSKTFSRLTKKKNGFFFFRPFPDAIKTCS